MNKKDRLEWIDFMKGFCMFSIVMCHVGWPKLYNRFFYPFFYLHTF